MWGHADHTRPRGMPQRHPVTKQTPRAIAGCGLHTPRTKMGTLTGGNNPQKRFNTLCTPLHTQPPFTLALPVLLSHTHLWHAAGFPGQIL